MSESVAMFPQIWNIHY